jgi:uncharacterized protein (TIGR03790 family)
MIRRIAPLLFLAALVRAAEPTPAGVAVLANSDDPESIALARHYLKARAIPENNLITLSLPKEEQITWETFVTKVRNPLLRELAAHGLLEGKIDGTPDAEGRIRISVTKNKVDFLVLCRGVPLKIAHDPARFEAREKSLTLQAQFQVNHASVDSELAVLPRTGTPLAGFVPNPWYNTENPPVTDTYDLLRVARLDGPSARDANRLIDNALEAERDGLLGRAYIDKGGPNAKGDEWLAVTEQLFRKATFDVSVDTAPTLIPAGARFDAPAFYFGWYAGDITGAPATPGFMFPPGAVALHIHSYSARTLRDPNAGWTGPLVARGATLSVGNVEEPYLELTHNPALLALGLLKGKSAGEAAAFAGPVLSWQTIVVGDPLYRPFIHDVPDQLKDIDGKRAEPARAYAAIRAALRLDAQGAIGNADEVLEKAFTRMPVLALAREIFDRQIKVGKSPTFRAGLLAPIAEDAGLVMETAEKLAAAGKSAEALALIEKQAALGVPLGARGADFARSRGKNELAARLTPKVARQ